MKKSISYWSFEGGLEGTRDVIECIQEAKKRRFQAIEICVGESGAFGLGTTKEKCETILKATKQTGVEISSVATGLYWNYSMTDDNPAIVEKAVENTKKVLQIANWLKTDTMLFIPGSVDVFFNPDFKPIQYDIVYKRAIKAIKQVLPTAAKLKVCLACENVWNKFLLSPLEMKQFIDGFKNKFVGSYFDVGNVLLTGFPEQWIRILGKRIKRVHLKDFKKSVGTAAGFCDLTEGDINWHEVMKAFRETGYNGYLTAEMMPYSSTLLDKTSDAMDKILKM
jgi:hexulose-6-phosphate isomerase